MGCLQFFTLIAAELMQSFSLIIKLEIYKRKAILRDGCSHKTSYFRGGVEGQYQSDMGHALRRPIALLIRTGFFVTLQTKNRGNARHCTTTTSFWHLSPLAKGGKI